MVDRELEGHSRRVTVSGTRVPLGDGEANRTKEGRGDRGTGGLPAAGSSTI